MTNSPESNMGKAAQADAAGIDHPDASVRPFQRHQAYGASGILLVAAGGLVIFPFILYYAAFLQAFFPGGWEEGCVLVSANARRVELDCFGFFFRNRWVDAIFLFTILVGAVAFFTRKIGFFLPLGISCTIIGFSDTFPRESSLHDSSVWLALAISILIILLIIFRVRAFTGSTVSVVLNIFALLGISTGVAALSAYYVGNENGTYGFRIVSHSMNNIEALYSVTGFSQKTFLEALEYVSLGVIAYTVFVLLTLLVSWSLRKLFR